MTSDPPRDDFERILNEYEAGCAEWLEARRDAVEFADRFDQVARDTVLPILDSLASRLKERGREAEVLSAPRALMRGRRPLNSDLHLIGGYVRLLVRPRGTGRPGDGLQVAPQGDPFFSVSCDLDERMVRGGREWWQLEEVTSDAVRNEAVRFIGELLTLQNIVVPTAPSGYLRGRALQAASGGAKGSVTIERIRVAEFMGGQIPPGIPLNVEIQHSDHQHSHEWLARYLQEALGIGRVHTHPYHRDPYVIQLRVGSNELEEVVRAIPVTVAEFNESYPQLLAEHERAVERKKAESAQEAAEEVQRFEAEQTVVDRLMNQR